MLSRNTRLALCLADTVVLPITSGRDSRTIFALLQDSSDRVTTFADDIAYIPPDIQVEPLLAKAAGLKWQKVHAVLRGLCLTGVGGDIFKEYLSSMVFWREVCAHKAPHLDVLPAGIPNFGGAELGKALRRLISQPFLPPNIRLQVASKEYLMSILRLIRLKLIRSRTKG